MENAILVAQFFGPVYLAVGLGFLVSPDHYEKLVDEFIGEKSSAALTYLGGVMAFFAGLVILHLHNSWNQDWTMVVTILGWLAVIKGALLLIVPNQFMGQFEGMVKSKGFLNFAKLFAIVLGAVFTYFGYFA